MVVFLAAAGLALVAAVASALRGGRYVHAEDEQVAAVVDDGAVGEVAVPPVAAEPESEDARRSAGASVAP